jgi:hypothetical protein
MEVIKQGDPSRLKKSKRFECVYCGCQFLADNNEYEYNGMWSNLLTYTCKCLCCGSRVYLEE